MNQCIANRIKLIVTAVWACGVVWFFVRNFPFRNLVEVVLNGLMLGILLFFFLTLGRWVFACFRVTFSSFMEECCFAFGLGTALTILFIIGLTALNVLYKFVVGWSLLIVFALLYKTARQTWIMGFHALAKSIRTFTTHAPGDIVLLFLMGGAGIATFIAAATPPFFYDAMVYHLAVPQQYLLQHGFKYLPHQPFSNFPANLGMLFLVGLSFSGGMLAKLLSWMFTPMAVFTVYAFVRKQWGSRMAILSAATAFLVPGILLISTLTAIDGGIVFYAFLGFTALLSWFHSRKRQWLVCAAFFCGITIGTKYTAIVTVMFPCVVMLALHEIGVKKTAFWKVVRIMLLFGGIALCLSAPWLIKNAVYTGNPFYPFLNAVFGSQGSQAVDYGQYLQTDHSLFVSRQQWADTIWQAVKAPWTVTMTTNGAAGKTGVLFLLCLPWILLLRDIDAPIKYILGMAVCGFWGWVFLLPWTLRYAFPVFPLLSIVTAYILCNIPASRAGKTVILGGITVLLGYQFAMFLAEELYVLRSFQYLLGDQPAEQFLLDHGLNYYPVAQYINRETPEDSTILIVGESRGYYCERAYLLHTIILDIDDNELPFRRLIVESESADEVVQKLHQMQITHILFNTAEMERFARQQPSRTSYFNFQTDKDRKVYQELLSPKYLRPLISQYDVSLFEVIRENGDQEGN